MAIEIPFDKKPPRLKDLVDKYFMGDVWVRDTPFGAVTDSLVVAQRFGLRHDNVLRAISKCRLELNKETKYKLHDQLIDCSYLTGPEGRERNYRKVDITEFGLMLLLLYINTPKARLISAEIFYRFFYLQTYLKGLNERQIDAIKGYYRRSGMKK